MAKTIAELIGGNNKSAGIAGGKGKSIADLIGQSTTPTAPTMSSNTKEDEDKNKGGLFGGIAYTLGKVGTGAASILEGIWDYTAGGIADLFGADEWAEEQFANNIVGGWNQSLDEWYNPGKGWQIAGDVASGLGNTLVGIGVAYGASLLSGGALAGPALGLITGTTMGLGAAGGATSEAYAKTGTLGGKEYLYGALQGATEGALEAVTGSAGKVGAKLFGKSTAESITKKSVLKGMLSSGLGEAFEEGVSEFVSPYFQRWTEVDPNAEKATWKQVGYAAMVGGLSGAIMDGLGTGVMTIKSARRGNKIIQNEKQKQSVVEMAQNFANYEAENNTGVDAYQYVSKLLEEYKTLETKATQGKLTPRERLRQKTVLAEMENADVVLTFEKPVQESAAKIKANADKFVEYLNSRGLKDSTGKAIHYENGAALLKDERMVTQLAVMDALGQLMLAPDTVYNTVSQGKVGGMQQADFDNFKAKATAQQKKAVGEMFGVDVDTVSYDDFVKAMQSTDAGKLEDIKTGMNVRRKSKQAIARVNNTNEQVSTFKKADIKNEGTRVYKTKDGNLFAVTKVGTDYYLFDGTNISKKLNILQTIGAINQLNGVEATQTSTEAQKTAQNKAVASGTENVSTESKTAQESQSTASQEKTEAEKKAEEEAKRKAEEEKKAKAKARREANAKKKAEQERREKQNALAKDFVAHMRKTSKERGGWYSQDVFKYVKEHPELNFIERIYEKDTTAKKDLADFLKSLDDLDTLDGFKWYMGGAYTGIAYGKYRGAAQSFQNAVKKRMQEVGGGTNLGIENHEATFAEVEELFYKLNKNPEVEALARRVFATAKRLGVNIRFTNDTFAKDQVAGDNVGDMVEYKTSYFNDTTKSDQQKASTIVHELIHTCTMYAMSDSSPIKSGNIATAAAKLKEIYDQIKDDADVKKEYGGTSADEMVAELSNEKFAALLKKKNLWQRILDAICEFFGFNRGTTAYDSAMQCLDYMLDNPDIGAYKQYAERQRRLLSYTQMPFGQLKGVETQSKKIDGKAEISTQPIKKYQPKQNKLDSNIQIVAKMKSVANLQGNEFMFGEKGLWDKIAQFYDSVGNNAYNEELGDVQLTKRGIKDSIAHGIGAKKTAAFKAVPAIIEKGKVVDYQVNWKNRGYDTAVISAPITVANEDYFAVAVVRRTAQNQRFYLHELDIKKRQTVLTEATSTTSSTKELGGLPINSIFDKLRNVNTFLQNSNKNIEISKKAIDSDGNTLTQKQQEYFKNSKVRDEQGNLLVVYHGSPNKFTEFSHSKIGRNGTSLGKGFYFTEDKSMSSSYFQEGGQLLKGYLDINKPLVDGKKTIKKDELGKLIKAVCEAQAKYMVEADGYDSIQDALKDTFISNYENTYDMPLANAYRLVTDKIYKSCDTDTDIIGELINGGGGTATVLAQVRKVLGFDGVIYEHSKTKHEYVAFESNQFKNADNANPTESADIRRQKSQSKDQKRSLDDAYFEQLIDELGWEDILGDGDLELYGDKSMSVEEMSEELNANPKKAAIYIRRTGLGKTHTADGKTAVMKQSRIDDAIEDSGAQFHKTYARSYITRISPKDFIDLTVMQNHLDRTAFDKGVVGDHGGLQAEYDYEKALQDSRQSPYLHIDKATGRIIGHNGRHRVRALEKAGIKAVEIEVQFYDEDGRLIKYDAETLPDVAISSQFDTAIETHLYDVMPLNETHRAKIEQSYGEKANPKAEISYKRIGVASDGKKIYESNFPKGTPKSAKSKRILDYIQNVWSKNPIKLVISNGETSRTILAKFDAYVDKDKTIPSDATKLAGGNRHGTHSEQRVTLDLADDYYEIASDSKYNYSKRETGKSLATHDNVKIWHYFVNDIYFAEYGETELKPYTVTINVKEKDNGDFVYSFNAEKEPSTRQTLHAAVSTYKGTNGELFFDNTISQKSNVVKSFSEKTQENLKKPDIRYQDRKPIKGEDKVMTEMPSDKVTVKDVITKEATLGQLTEQIKGNAKDNKTALQVLTTNAQAAVEKEMKAVGIEDATAKTNYVRAGKAAAQNAIDIEGAQYNLTGDKRVGESLGKIWQPIYEADKKDGKTYRDFQLYLLHHHNVDRYAVGKPVFNEWSNSIEQHVTDEHSRKAIADLDKQYPWFRKQAEKIWKFNDNNLQLEVDSGKISQEYADTLREMYPHYVPTMREEHRTSVSTILGKNNIKVNNSIKVAKGSSSNILPIDEQMAAQTVQKITSARLNSLLVDMVEHGSTDNFQVLQSEDVDIDTDSETEVTLSKDEKKNTHQITFYHNGKAVTAQVSDLFYTGVEAFQKGADVSNNAILGITAKMNSLFKKAVTSWNPFFSFFKNPMRDLQDALLYTKYGTKKYLTNYKKAWKEISNNGKYWREAKAAGLSAASVYSYADGIEYKQKGIEAKRTAVKKKVENASNTIEMAPRLAEYICAREAGLSVEEALLQAQDVTTNFGRGGTLARKLNATIMPFLNPSIQGFSKMARAFMGEGGKKAWVALIIKSLLLGVGATALNDLINGDDDEEYENLSDYVKEQNYVLGLGDGDFLKIPKGRVLSVFGSVYLRGKRYAQGDDKAWKGYLSSIASSVTPVDNITRNIFSPFMDIKTNSTWYGGTIEGQKWEDTRPENRYDETTSKISIWLGQVFNYSPLKINYLLEQYTGVVGDLVLPATSAENKGGGVGGALSGVVTQNMLTNATMNSKWSGKWYDTIEEYTYKKTDGDLQAKATVQYLTRINKTISEMYTQKRQILGDTTLSQEERSLQTRILQATINTQIQETLGNLDFIYNEFGKYNLTDEAEYKQAYMDVLSLVEGEKAALEYYSTATYEKATELTKLGVDYTTYYDYYFGGLKDIDSDRKADGTVISGSKKKKVIAYTMAQDIPTLQKLILIMSQGYTIADGDIKGISARKAKQSVAKYIASLQVSKDEKTAIAKMLGFTVKNGKIVIS